MNFKLKYSVIIISFALRRIEALDLHNDEGSDRRRMIATVSIELPTFPPVDIRIPIGSADEQSPKEEASPAEAASFQTDQATTSHNHYSQNTNTTSKNPAENSPSMTPIDDKSALSMLPTNIESIENEPNNKLSEPPKNSSNWCPTHFSGNGGTCSLDLPSGASWIQCAYSKSINLQTCTCMDTDPFWRCKSNAQNSDALVTVTTKPSIESTTGQINMAEETPTQTPTELIDNAVKKTSSAAPDVFLSTPSFGSSKPNKVLNPSLTPESNNGVTVDVKESHGQPSAKAPSVSSSSPLVGLTGPTHIPNPSPTSESDSDLSVDETDSPSQAAKTPDLSDVSSFTSPDDSTGSNKATITESDTDLAIDVIEYPNVAPNAKVVPRTDIIDNPSSPASLPINWPTLVLSYHPAYKQTNNDLTLSPTNQVGSPTIAPYLPPLTQKFPPGIFTKRTSPPSPTETPTILPTTNVFYPTIADNMTDISACRNASSVGRRTVIFRYLTSLSEERALNDTAHPAFMAGSWIADEDQHQVCPGDPNFTQRYVLALLYFSASGDNWMRCTRTPTRKCSAKRFLSDFNECDWGGVSCDSQNRVRKLNLDENNMRGSIPKELRYLEHLYELDFDSNDLIGHFPSWVGSMRYLEKLDLDRNILSGPIPEELYSSTSLKYVDIDRNILSGTISSNIGAMSQLVFFQVDFNQLIGTLPTEIANISDLQYFSVFGNGFDDSVGVPSDICGFHIQIYANCKMCEEVGDCCTVCLPEDLRDFY